MRPTSDVAEASDALQAVRVHDGNGHSPLVLPGGIIGLSAKGPHGRQEETRPKEGQTPSPS
jgi:hypothetical protein